MEEDLIINLDNACRASFNVLYVIWLLAELMNNLKSGIQIEFCCVLAYSYPVSIHNWMGTLSSISYLVPLLASSYLPSYHRQRLTSPHVDAHSKSALGCRLRTERDPLKYSLYRPFGPNPNVLPICLNNPFTLWLVGRHKCAGCLATQVVKKHLVFKLTWRHRFDGHNRT